MEGPRFASVIYDHSPRLTSPQVAEKSTEEKKQDDSGKEAAATALPSNSPPSSTVVEDPFEALSKRFDALKKR